MLLGADATCTVATKASNFCQQWDPLRRDPEMESFLNDLGYDHVIARNSIGRVIGDIIYRFGLLSYYNDTSDKSS